MNKIFVLLSAFAIFAGCASSPHKLILAPAVPAPIQATTPASAVSPAAPVVDTNQNAELQAMRAAIHPVTVPVATVTKPVVTSTPVTTAPAPVAAVAVPVSVTSQAVAAVQSSITKTTKAAKSHKLIFVLIGLAVVGAGGYFTRKYWLPLWTKLLAWLKSHNVVSELKTLASEAETKVETAVKDVEAKVEPSKAPTPTVAAVASPAPVSVSVTAASHTAAPATTATHAFATAEAKKA